MPGLGDAHALAFEAERLGHDRDREDAHLARDLGHHRRRAGAGAAAHAGGDEAHVRPGEPLADRLALLERGRAAGLRLRAGAEPGRAELELLLGEAARERLRVGVGGDELHPGHAVADHVVHRVTARAAHAHDLDDRPRCLVAVYDLEHALPPCLCGVFRT